MTSIATGPDHKRRTRAIEATMLFMIIERFVDNDMVPVYRRLRAAGRGLPDGVRFIESWVEPGFARCFQIMECDDLQRLQQWALHWRGAGVTFEIVPVVTSGEAAAVLETYLDQTDADSGARTWLVED